MKSADPLDAFDQAIGNVIGRLVPTTVLYSRSGDKQWFDASCQRAYGAKQAQVLVRLHKQFINNFVFFTWACAAGFNNNKNNNNIL